MLPNLGIGEPSVHNPSETVHGQAYAQNLQILLVHIRITECCLIIDLKPLRHLIVAENEGQWSKLKM